MSTERVAVSFKEGLASMYEIDDADVLSILLFLYLEYRKSGKQLCKCKNCNRAFIPTLRKEEVYCSHTNIIKSQEELVANRMDRFYDKAVSRRVKIG